METKQSQSNVSGELQVLVLTDTGVKHWNTLYRVSNLPNRARALSDLYREVAWVQQNPRKYAHPQELGEGRILINGDVVTHFDLTSQPQQDTTEYQDMNDFEDRFMSSMER